jgi:two-component system, LytTR family, sensor kinase
MKQEETETATAQSNNSNSIKWRQHEMILATATAIMLAAGYAWNIYKTPTVNFDRPFVYNHVPFNLYKNVVVPAMGTSLLIYLAYLWINLYILPRLLFPKKKEVSTSAIGISFNKLSLQGLAKKLAKKYAWLFLQTILLTAILGTAYNVATYFQHQWQFNYPGFSIFFNKNIPQSQLDIGGGYFVMASIVLVYAAYVAARETLIYLINNSKQKEYNIQVCNKITAFTVLFISVPVFLISFHNKAEPQFLVAYTLTVPAFFAMFISNVYWLFPMKGNGSFFSKKIISRLLSTSFIYALPLTGLVHEAAPIAFLYGWAILLFIATPLTWLYFQSNKDKIVQLLIVEKQLVRSKADLQFLRSQINPHFLFNTLNTLYGTALQENAGRTAEGIQRLGDMMRFMLEENNLDFINMHKEIDYLNNYIALQKLRTQSLPGIVIEDHINDQHCNHRIAPMLLIPLVENAFKHGISLNEQSWIVIKLSCNEKEIVFEVRNSMHAKTNSDPEKERSGIGFKNVVERLKLIYPGKHKVLVNQDGKEFFVQISIEP